MSIKRGTDINYREILFNAIYNGDINGVNSYYDYARASGSDRSYMADAIVAITKIRGHLLEPQVYSEKNKRLEVIKSLYKKGEKILGNKNAFLELFYLIQKKGAR